MKKYFIIIVLFLSSVYKTHAQITVSGTVKDSLNKPVASASVTLQNKQSNLIVAYAITNVKGGFQIQYNTLFAADSFYVLVNCLGYTAKKFLLTNNNLNIECVLMAGNIVLPNVLVQNKKPYLKLKGDTLDYAVDSFKNVQDRTIGDVLRKMPGIDMDANGKISYNGKPISNFYIDGDNLLDDKYNLATNSIGADMVDKVQVLENHQPIKVLKDATISNNVAINLSLKDKARLKLNGHAEVGEGYSTENNYDATVNLMAFRKKYKAINSIKTNNTGVDIADDIISHNIADYFKLLDHSVPQTLLDLGSAGNAGISKQRYLFNNAQMLNVNNLFKTKNETQIRLNAYYLHDEQYTNYNSNSIYYFPTDTFNYYELQHAETVFNKLRVQVNINDNKNKHYLNSTIVAEINNQPATANVTTSFNQLQQNLKQQVNNFSNDLSYIKTFGKTIIEGSSYINYLSQPEVLKISPGISANIFNNNLPYTQFIQNANVPTWFTNNYITIRKPAKHVLQAYKLGFSGQWQQLQSNINIQQNSGLITNAVDSFSNKLNWQHYKFYTETNYDFIGERNQLSFNLPVNYQYIQYADTLLKNNKTISRILFNPSVRFKYATGQENFVSGSYSYNNNIGNIENVYGGYILKNYRLLANNDMLIPEGSSHKFSLGFNFRKTIKIFFFNVYASYGITNTNSLVAASFYQTMQKQTTIFANNQSNNFMLMAGSSKYIFALHTTVSLKASYQQSTFYQLQNNSLQQYSNYTQTIGGGINSKLTQWFNAAYNFSFTNYSSKNIATKNIQPNQSTQLLQQNIDVNIIPTQNFYFRFKGEDFYVQQTQLNNNTHYFFADASFTYKANKIRTDFLLDIQNIADVRQFTTVSLSANNLSQSNYIIRPRMFLLKAIFNF
ncbi:MAG: carboxypeptidase regulatory-like domain-containing protein [Bacteroidetes bacterium]|nr:carboxypeptidase regulatory-like domain-containing protein [Bacteroidota bacterium]MBS1670295.1 carboxypeptidase regulatory-like domain-containing protein [Bacteroidota bacterium]